MTHINDVREGIARLYALDEERVAIHDEAERKLTKIGLERQELSKLIGRMLLKERYGVPLGMRAVLLISDDGRYDDDPGDNVQFRVFAGLAESVSLADEPTETIIVRVRVDDGPAAGQYRSALLSHNESNRIWLAGDKSIPAGIVAKINKGL